MKLDVKTLVGIAVAAAAVFVVGLITAYSAGQSSSRGAIDCERGTVLEMTWVEGRGLPNEVAADGSADNATVEPPSPTTATEIRRLSIGDCSRIEESAFVAAVSAIATADRNDPDCPEEPANTVAASTTTTADESTTTTTIAADTSTTSEVSSTTTSAPAAQDTTPAPETTEASDGESSDPCAQP